MSAQFFVRATLFLASIVLGTQAYAWEFEFRYSMPTVGSCSDTSTLVGLNYRYYQSCSNGNTAEINCVVQGGATRIDQPDRANSTPAAHISVPCVGRFAVTQLGRAIDRQITNVQLRVPAEEIQRVVDELNRSLASPKRPETAAGQARQHQQRPEQVVPLRCEGGVAPVNGTCPAVFYPGKDGLAKQKALEEERTAKEAEARRRLEEQARKLKEEERQREQAELDEAFRKLMNTSPSGQFGYPPALAGTPSQKAVAEVDEVIEEKVPTCTTLPCLWRQVKDAGRDRMRKWAQNNLGRCAPGPASDGAEAAEQGFNRIVCKSILNVGLTPGVYLWGSGNVQEIDDTLSAAEAEVK